MEDCIFEMPDAVDRNSYEFDLALLDELKHLHTIPVRKFETTIRKIMRNKSTCKLWYTNNPSKEWDYMTKTYRECNYRCIPVSRKARHYFCLVLDRSEEGITVKDGFLTSA